MNKIQIKRLSKDVPVPAYKTLGAAGLDLATSEDLVFAPKELKMVPLGVALKVPEGFYSLLVPRSSLFKSGLVQVNGVGVMDQDYCGDEDQWLIPLMNYTDQEVKITKGQRIAQFIVLPYQHFEIEEVETLNNKSRGSFGTTGKH